MVGRVDFGWMRKLGWIEPTALAADALPLLEDDRGPVDGVQGEPGRPPTDPGTDVPEQAVLPAVRLVLVDGLVVVRAGRVLGEGGLQRRCDARLPRPAG
ncbi:hypothetical protein [Kitasatospora sp. NPDC092286]|uniref:hypothetical protein n=1 Tax=Kitasatospora sp. NPDC092286 TaxID=3364087 RepID=UPI00381CF388